MNELLRLLSQPGSLTSLIEQLSIGDVSETLDGREEQSFDSQWVSAFERRPQNLGSEEESAINALREVVFKAVFRKTGEDDLAGYASDDFELIGRALAGGTSDPFVNALWIAYAQGKFPAGDLRLVTGDLAPLVDETLNRPS
jgi:hypothetical protein